MPDKPKFGKTGTEFDALAKKYTEKGWDSLTTDEKSKYRSWYSSMVVPNQETGTYDAIGMMEPAEVEGKRLPYGSGLLPAMQRDVVNPVMKGLGYVGETLSTPFAPIKSAVKNYGPAGGTPAVMAINAMQNYDEILPSYITGKQQVQTSDALMTPEQKKNNPYLAGGIDLATGFLEPSLGLGAVAKTAEKIARAPMKAVMNPKNFRKDYGSILDTPWNPTNLSNEARLGISAHQKYKTDVSQNIRKELKERAEGIERLDKAKKSTDEAIGEHLDLIHDPRYLEKAKALDKYNKRYLSQESDETDLFLKFRKKAGQLVDDSTDNPKAIISNYKPKSDSPSDLEKEGFLKGDAFLKTGLSGIQREITPSSVPFIEKTPGPMEQQVLWSRNQLGVPTESGKPYNIFINKNKEYFNDRPEVGGYYSPIKKLIDLNPEYADLPDFKNTVKHEIRHAEQYGPTGYVDKSSYKRPLKDFVDYKHKGKNKNVDYRLDDDEIDTWFNKNFRQDLIRKGILKDEFAPLTEKVYNNKVIWNDDLYNKYFKPSGFNIIKDTDKFLGWFNRSLPFVTGAAATGAAAIGASQQYRSGGRPGLWANIHAKRERIKKGSGEKMRKPGSKGAPTDEAIKRSQAKFGMANPYMQQGGMVPVEIEKEERVFIKNNDGSYSPYLETPSNAPTHEEGGIKTLLPKGSFVFPKQYYGMLDEAMAHGGETGDWSKMENAVRTMKKNARKAFMEGKPYSSGGASSYKCGGKVKKYADGGMVLPNIPKTIQGMQDYLKSIEGYRQGLGFNMKPFTDAAFQSNNTILNEQGQTEDEYFDQMESDLADQEADQKTWAQMMQNVAEEQQKAKQQAMDNTYLPKGGVKHPGNKGYLSGQQQILNNLIANDTSADKPAMLVEDDILGSKTRAAMNYYQTKGLYNTPELFSEVNVEQYKKNWANMTAAQKEAALKEAGIKPTSTTDVEDKKPLKGYYDKDGIWVAELTNEELKDVYGEDYNELIGIPEAKKNLADMPWYMNPNLSGMPDMSEEIKQEEKIKNQLPFLTRGYNKVKAAQAKKAKAGEYLFDQASKAGAQAQDLIQRGVGSALPIISNVFGMIPTPPESAKKADEKEFKPLSENVQNFVFGKEKSKPDKINLEENLSDVARLGSLGSGPQDKTGEEKARSLFLSLPKASQQRLFNQKKFQLENPQKSYSQYNPLTPFEKAYDSAKKTASTQGDVNQFLLGPTEIEENDYYRFKEKYGYMPSYDEVSEYVVRFKEKEYEKNLKDKMGPYYLPPKDRRERDLAGVGKDIIQGGKNVIEQYVHKKADDYQNLLIKEAGIGRGNPMTADVLQYINKQTKPLRDFSFDKVFSKKKDLPAAEEKYQNMMSMMDEHETYIRKALLNKHLNAGYTADNLESFSKFLKAYENTPGKNQQDRLHRLARTINYYRKKYSAERFKKMKS